MVYKRFIHRDGKRFGPYYYESYRDKKGIARTRYVAAHKPKRTVTKPFEKVSKPEHAIIHKPAHTSPVKGHPLLFILLGAMLLIILGVFFLSYQVSLDEQADLEQEDFTFKGIFKGVYGFFTGLTTEEEPIEEAVEEEVSEEPAPEPEPTEEIEEPSEEVVEEEIIEEEVTEEEIVEEPVEEEIEEEVNETEKPEIVEEEVNETEEIEEPEENVTEVEENITEIEEINESIEENTTEVEEQIEKEIEKELEKPEKPSIIINETEQNFTIPNETIANITNQTIVNETIVNITANVSTLISTSQYGAVLGEPVKWEKKVKVLIEGADSTRGLKVKLPKKVENVSVRKLTDIGEEEISDYVIGEEVQEEIDELDDEEPEEPVEESQQTPITGILNFIIGLLRGVMTGMIIEEPVVEEISVEINEEIQNEEEVIVEYYTDAPYSIEKEIEKGKEVKIIGPKDMHYENVLAYTTLDESLNADHERKIKIYWVEDKKYVPIEKIDDINKNGIYDYVEWIVPNLSNQTFQIIIEITKAEHLDSNRSFISDIYDEVKALDDLWSEVIPDGDYVRVTFEQELTSNRDITIYPRIVNGTPKIEIYEIDEYDIIAVFSSLESNEYNKVYLTSLNGSQDTFDLWIINGIIEINHIIDPGECTGGAIDCGSLGGGDCDICGCVYNIRTRVCNGIGNEDCSDLGEADCGTCSVCEWSGGGDTTNPTVTMGTNPIASYNDSDGSITFDIKCSDNINVSNMTLWATWSGSWAANETNSSPINDTYWNVTVANIPDGTWTWGAHCMDNSSNEDWNDANRTLTVDTTNPTASFGTDPVDAFNGTSSSVTFDLKCSDNIEVDTLQLWTNTTGTWHANQTNSSPINNTFWNVSASNIGDGDYIWAVYCNDTLGNSDWSNSNRTLNIQTINVTLSKPDDASTDYDGDITFECNVTDDSGIVNVSLYTNTTGTWHANQTTTLSTGDETGHYTTANNGSGTYTLTYQPNATYGKDNTFSNASGYPDLSYGGNTWLWTREVTYSWRGIVEFDLSIIPSSATIVNATLSLYNDDVSTATSNLHLLTSTWNEGNGTGQANNDAINGSTWNERWYGQNWGSAGGDYNATIIDSDSGGDAWHNYNVTDEVTNIVAGAITDYGFMVRCPTCQFDEHYFHSSDSGTASLRPKLVVIYTIPTSYNASFDVNNLPSDYYIWNCLAYDVDGNSDLGNEPDANWTFTVDLDTTNPTASFGTDPVNNYNSTLQSVTFDLKCSDNVDVDTLQLWSDWSGSWTVNETNSSPINDTYWNVTVNNIPIGTWNWSVYCNDSVGNDDWADTNRTLKVSTVTTNLISPSNGASEDASVTFECNATSSDNSLQNISLYGNWSGGWHLNETVSITTLQLTSGNVSEDIFVTDLGAPDAHEIQLKFDISNIPSNVYIDNATLCLYMIDKDTAGGQDNDANFARINNQTWNEGISASDYNSLPQTNTTSSYTWNSTTNATWSCIEVTNGLKTDYDLGNSNTTFRFDDPDQTVTSADTVNDTTFLRFGFSGVVQGYFDFASSEHSNTSIRPYLLVTYHANFQKTFSDGSYLWNCYACDDKSCDFAASNWSFSVDTCELNQISSSTTLTADECAYYNISADDVVFDCDGYTINGNNSGTYWAVEATNRDNVTIKDCNFQQYGKVILFNNTHNSNITNNTLYNNSHQSTNVETYGIYLKTSNTTRIDDNNITKLWTNSTNSDDCYTGTLYGLYIDSSNTLTFDSNTLEDVNGQYYGDTQGDIAGCQGGYMWKGDGVYIDNAGDSSNLDFLSSNITDIRDYGILFFDGSTIFINDSNIVDIGDNAIYFDNSYSDGDINIYRTHINYSYSDSIDVQASSVSDKITISECDIHHSSGEGINIEDDSVTNGADILNNRLSNLSGIYIDSDTTNSNISNNMLRDDGAGFASGEAGIFLPSGAGSGSIVNNNTIYNLDASGSYGIEVRSTLASISDNNITNCGYGIYFNTGDNIVMWNSTISNCSDGDIRNNGADNVSLYNITFNKSNVDFVNDGNGYVLVYYLFRVNVTDQNIDPIESASVNISDANGVLLVDNDTTDASGLTTWRWTMEYNQSGDAAYSSGCTGSGSYINCSTPHNVTAEKTGYSTNSTNITVDDHKTGHVILRTPTIDAYSPTTDNFSIAEPNNQTFSIVFTNSSPITIKWFVNGTEQTSDANSSQYIWQGNYSQEGVYEIKVNISNPVGEDDQIWIMTVNNTPASVNLDVLYPPGDMNASQYSFFNITLNITCGNTDDCGTINVSVFDNGTLTNTTAGATPFYTNSSTNPVTSSSLNAGQSETLIFWVNATGSVSDIYEFYVQANLTSNLSIGNTSSAWNVTIDVQVFSVAVSLSSVLSQPINWSIVSLPTTNQAAPDNNETHANKSSYFVNISVSGGTADLYIKGDNLTTSGGDILLVGNETFKNITNSGDWPGSYFGLTTNYSDNLIASGLSNYDVVYLNFYINAPSAQAAGTYNNTLYFKAVKTGEPP